MLFIILSRTMRKIYGKNPPSNCYANIWFPYNITDYCDCNYWCKYPQSNRKITL